MYQKKKGTSKMKQDELAAAEAREKEAAKKDRLEKEEAERQEKVRHRECWKSCTFHLTRTRAIPYGAKRYLRSGICE
jgi:hypothetical protein